jgi:hypothetical protein
MANAFCRVAALALAAGLLVTPATAGEPSDELLPSADEARRLWMGRLDGRHFTSRVLLRIERRGDTEERLIDVWRDDRGGVRERVMARFEAPPDMRDFALLYIENADGPNDYFIYQPASQRVRRVPEELVRQDVYGVDLEYLGFGVALIEPAEIESLAWDDLEGRRTLRVSERALRENQRFERRAVWLDPTTWVPLRTEHHLRGQVRLVARTDEVRMVQGTATPVRVSFERPLDGEKVSMQVQSIDYERPIPEAFFSTLRLILER